MFSRKKFLVLAIAASSVVAHAQTSRMTLDDIDALSREKVVRDLRAAQAPGAASAAGVQAAATPVATAPVPAAPAKAVRHPVEKPRAEPVTFVGAYTDGGSSYVLYAFEGAVYPAKVGATLLNGWVAKGVNGYLITVAEGRSTWSVPIRSEAPVAAPVATAGPLQALSDLNGPLPPGGVTGPYSPAPAISMGVSR